jgi:hypothetical protein
MSRVQWLFLPLCLFGCSSGSDPSGSTPPLDASSNSNHCGLTVMAQQCAVVGCHIASSGSPAQANLDLSTAAVGDGKQLVNAPAQGSFCAASSTPPPVIIDPHNPENSLLYDKLQSKPVCGPQMPFLRPVLMTADQQCILDWIKTVPGVGG